MDKPRRLARIYSTQPMKKQIVLHTGLDPTAVADLLRRSMDEEQRTLFSLSGYKGELPVLGMVAGDALRLQRRRYWRNDFAPQFYGQIVPEPGGTRIEGHFDLSEWVRGFMRVWLAAVAVIGIPMFIFTLVKVLHGDRTENDTVALVVPPALIIFGSLLPKFGRLIAIGEESFLLQHLQNVLSARIDPEH